MISDMIWAGQVQDDADLTLRRLFILLTGAGIVVFMVSVVTLFAQNRADGVTGIYAIGLVPIFLVVGLLIGFVLVALGAGFLITAAVALGCGLLAGLTLIASG